MERINQGQRQLTVQAGGHALRFDREQVLSNELVEWSTRVVGRGGRSPPPTNLTRATGLGDPTKKGAR